MSATNDGGPAFPRTYRTQDGVFETEHSPAGMSLRDWFAGKTLTALLVSPGIHAAIAESKLTPDDVCLSSYEWAGRMLKAREGGVK